MNSRIATTAGADYERLSSQQAFKRTLPYTSQSYAPPTKSNNLVDNLGSIQIRDEAVGSENRDFRVLPVSLAPGKSIPSSQYPSEHPYRPGYGEELAPGSDERLIYQAALEVILI